MDLELQERLAQYAPVRLQVDQSRLSDWESKMIPLLIEAAQAMDEPFWIQNYGDLEALVASTDDPDLQRLLRLNYGPWDRLRENEPFIEGAGQKPAGANFYPADMTREEFNAAARERQDLKSPFTMVRRNDRGELAVIPYHIFFREHLERAAEKLQQAAELAENSSLKKYLLSRAEALMTDEYRASDFAWIDVKDNTIDILIGPMEVEDRLLGIKTAYASSILIKDWEETKRLENYRGLLPRFQANFPVPDAYKQARPSLEGELAVYDVAYYAGNDKASTPLGIAWPDDEEVQLAKGTRAMLLQNMMRSRFEYNLLPLSELLIAEDQREHITFDANFTDIMLHELAHGLGVKRTISTKGSVQKALQELDYAMEELKADALSLFMLGKLHEWGYLNETVLLDGYVTSLLKMLYNGDSRQSIARMNFFREIGAYSRDPKTETYRVHTDAMPGAVSALVNRVLRLQGDGDYAGAKAFFERYGVMDEDMQRDNDQIDASGLPMGLAIEQG